MSKEKNASQVIRFARKILIYFVSLFVLTIILMLFDYLVVRSIKTVTLRNLFVLVSFLCNIGILTFMVRRMMKSARVRFEELIDRNTYYESILDAVPFPVHVTDNDMKWAYMNKAFEKMLSANGVISDRDSAYGLACSTAGANICNTENCGIRQLREKGKGETYFDWCDQKCKQDTSEIRDRFGKVTGYVEVVTDLTSILKVNEYAKNEIERLSESLDKISNGNLDVTLEITPADQYTQEMSKQFQKIYDSLAKVRSAINTMSDEAEKLVRAGLEGELEVRGDASSLNGVYAQIIDGVNKTFDSIKAPLDVASEFIQNLAEGVLQETIENHYKGYYSALVENLNHARNSLQTLLEETTKLVDAETHGDLAVRGDIRNTKGAYLNIIKGFNQSLDAVVIPLKESMKVMGEFAYNDYALQMSENYQGAFKEFAVAINLVRTRLVSVQDAIVKLGEGDLSRLEEFKKIGKRSENDKIMPAVTGAYQTIYDLIESSNDLATAAYEGRLDVRGDVDQFKGGYRRIIEGMNKTMEAVAAPINESSSVLQQFEQGDLTVSMTGEYRGSYDLIKTGLNGAIESFNELLSDISVAADQVAMGSKQVSDGSQSLSQGATEQASSLEELTASITEVSAQTKENATNASQANSLASSTQSETVQSTEKMNQMLDSMKEINESSANISKINKVIDDIAFQTNILALNAAVEAARAGQYGKGFAVVAEEVRNLAAKSAEAAKETTSLIESSIVKVENGTRIASETANSLSKISDSIRKMNLLVGNIATASNQQATAIAQIDQGLSQVSTVVQTNSATSEESAASSEELSGQADTLKNMVGRFILKNTKKQESRASAKGNLKTALRQERSFNLGNDKY